METLTTIDINCVNFSKLSLESLCEIYAENTGIAIWTEAGKNNLIKSLEYQRGQGKIKFPKHPSKKLLNELN